MIQEDGNMNSFREWGAYSYKYKAHNVCSCGHPFIYFYPTCRDEIVNEMLLCYKCIHQFCECLKFTYFFVTTNQSVD